MAPMNQAIKFVKNLCAMFSKFPISQETKDQLIFRLSKWRNLTETQWDKVLDYIVYNRGVEDRGLPELPEIYSAINLILRDKAQESEYGIQTFRINDYDYSVRLVRRDNIWISLKTGKLFIPPVNATDIHFAPDKEAYSEPEDIPSKDEQSRYMKQIMSELSKIGSMTQRKLQDQLSFKSDTQGRG